MKRKKVWCRMKRTAAAEVDGIRVKAVSHKPHKNKRITVMKQKEAFVKQGRRGGGTDSGGRCHQFSIFCTTLLVPL